LNSYECVASDTNAASLNQSSQDKTNPPANPPRRRGPRRGGDSVKSPDEKWSAFVRDHNVFVQSEAEGTNTTEVQLSADGSETNSYAQLEWSPDSQSLVAWRVEHLDAQANQAAGGSFRT
jgi:hypothetical protein